jgi:hypothetical protein
MRILRMSVAGFQPAGADWKSAELIRWKRMPLTALYPRSATR